MSRTLSMENGSLGSLKSSTVAVPFARIPDLDRAYERVIPPGTVATDLQRIPGHPPDTGPGPPCPDRKWPARRAARAERFVRPTNSFLSGSHARTMSSGRSAPSAILRPIRHLRTGLRGLGVLRSRGRAI